MIARRCYDSSTFETNWTETSFISCFLKLMDNAEINNLVKIVGLQYKLKYETPESLQTLRLAGIIRDYFYKDKVTIICRYKMTVPVVVMLIISWIFITMTCTA